LTTSSGSTTFIAVIQRLRAPTQRLFLLPRWWRAGELAH
jgi:hypothetical protein